MLGKPFARPVMLGKPFARPVMLLHASCSLEVGGSAAAAGGACCDRVHRSGARCSPSRHCQLKQLEKPPMAPLASTPTPCPRRASQASPALRPLLERVVLLYALYRTEQDMGWLLGEEVLPPAAGRAVSDAVRRLCAELAPHYK